MSSQVFEIAGAAQSYEWGALGPKSKVAHYAKGLPNFEYDEKKPYAEVRCQGRMIRCMS